MLLTLARIWYTENSTIGVLLIDGAFECYTLEDMVREVKLPGRTAIPQGSYDVNITFSPKFNKDMPLIENVPEFTGVRIHCGNTDSDTEGCILVGGEKYVDAIGKSRIAFNSLFEKLKKADFIKIDVKDRLNG